MANATQKAKLIGQLKSLKRTEVKTTASGKEFVDYNARIVLSNGVSIFNRKRFWSPNEPSDHTAKAMSDYEDMIEVLETALVNQETLFVEKRISPSKSKDDAKVLMNTFNSFTSYIKDDGTIGFGTEGDIILIDSEKVQPLVDEEDEVVDYEITFEGQKGDYQVLFSEAKNTILLEMVLVDINIEKRLFTLEDLQEYTKQVVIELMDGYALSDEQKPPVGVGIKGEVIFIKGDRVESEAVADESFEWGQEAKETKPTYNPDRIVFKPLGKIESLVKDVKADKKSATKTTKASKPADTDF